MTRPVRLQLSRRRGFNLQALSLATNGLPAVNVARPSKWGNPWRASNASGSWMVDGPRANPFQHPCGNKGGAAMVAIECFSREPEGAASMETAALRGRNLACWCALSDPCHASVLLEIANRPTCEALP